MKDISTMAQYLIWAMEKRPPMTNQQIYRAVEDVCRRHGRKLPNEWEAQVRETLQAHCATSPQHNGKDDFFTHHRRGVWSCKETSPSLDDLA
jgi:hypothetical protein